MLVMLIPAVAVYPVIRLATTSCSLASSGARSLLAQDASPASQFRADCRRYSGVMFHGRATAAANVRDNGSMLDWSQCPEVERSPEKVSGSWVFRGTRVPVRALFENLEGGASIEDFLAWFPGVERRQVEAVLECASQSLSPSASR